jgi:hypothetical protein
MLLKAIQYFSNNMTKSPNAKGYIFVSGETHWNYRICVEAVALTLVCLMFLGGSLNALEPAGAQAMVNFAIGTAVLGAVELIRLFRKRAAEIAFAEIFYG